MMRDPKFDGPGLYRIVIDKATGEELFRTRIGGWDDDEDEWDDKDEWDDDFEDLLDELLFELGEDDEE